MEKEDFFRQFSFEPKKEGFVGIERERFLKNFGSYSARSDLFLEKSQTITRAESIWTAELSRCQVEDRTCPKEGKEKIKIQLERNDQEGKKIARECGLELYTEEVAGEDLPLAVYPRLRYQKIKESLDQEVLEAACRVTGTHIHLGMANMSQAISVHNRLRGSLDFFSDLGDHSQGKRLALYKKVAADPYPPCYKDKQHFFEVAKDRDFASNPRNCWHLLRISVHGTVELRMFGSTDNLEEIINWVEQIRARAKLS